LGVVILCTLLSRSICPGQTIVAKTAVELLAALRHPADNTTIRLSAGTYYFPRPIQIPAAFGLVLEADPKAEVVLSAGELIADWKPDTLNGHDGWSAYLPEVRLGILDFRELWVNGARAKRARFPATGYLLSHQSPDKEKPWNQGQTWFGYKPGDLPDELPVDAEAMVMNRWEDSRLPDLSVDAIHHRVNSSRKTVFQPQDGDPYFLEGASDWLAKPGDWYLDHHKGILYYLPRAGETLERAVAVVPTHDRILDLKHGTSVTLRGLTFSHSEWNLPEQLPEQDPKPGGFGQAEIGVQPAVALENCARCRVESCRFQHLGNYALELGAGCRDNIIDHCTFTDLGTGGIKIGLTKLSGGESARTGNNTVTDCRISDGGHLFPSAVGIWVGQSFDNKIVHNEISDLYYTAISIGWTWGYGPSPAQGNRVEYNIAHHLGKKSDGDGPILSDMGAVYTVGVQAGTVISNNVFHDIAGRVYGGWGIYLDEGSSNVLIEKNLVYRTTDGGFHLHFGRNDTVRNNIFASGRDVQIARTDSEPTQALLFTSNIVSWDSGVFTETNAVGAKFDSNLYHCFGNGLLRFGNESWTHWQMQGEDRHSLLGDPGFEDPNNGNFSIKSKEIQKIVFQPLDVVGAGPRNAP
jgi:parallel beta-helix repeat protein